MIESSLYNLPKKKILRQLYPLQRSATPPPLGKGAREPASGSEASVL